MNTSRTNEHRAVPRVPGDTVGPLKLRAELLAETFSATVRDISIQGIGLIANQSFCSGTTLVIEAGPAGKSLPADLKATVRHATTLPDGRWVIGCVFSRSLTAADFEVLG